MTEADPHHPQMDEYWLIELTLRKLDQEKERKPHE